MPLETVLYPISDLRRHGHAHAMLYTLHNHRYHTDTPPHFPTAIRSVQRGMPRQRAAATGTYANLQRPSQPHQELSTRYVKHRTQVLSNSFLQQAQVHRIGL